MSLGGSLMSLQNRILLPVLVAILIAGIGTFIGISTTIHSMVDDQVAGQQAATESAVAEAVDTKIHEYEAFLSATQDAMTQQASLFSRLDFVEESYRVALSGNIDDEFDAKGQEARQMLRAATTGYTAGYREQTGAKNFDLHFHLPNSHSLLRVGQMDWQTKRDGKKLDISDDLSSFRPTVTQVNRERKGVKGIEVGRGGFAVRGLVPVTGGDGSHLGSVEMLGDFNAILTKLKSSGKEEFAVYMDARLLDIAIGSPLMRVNRVIIVGGAPHHFMSIVLSPRRSRVVLSQSIDLPAGTALAINHDVRRPNL